MLEADSEGDLAGGKHGCPRGSGSAPGALSLSVRRASLQQESFLGLSLSVEFWESNDLFLKKI